MRRDLERAFGVDELIGCEVVLIEKARGERGVFGGDTERAITYGDAGNGGNTFDRVDVPFLRHGDHQRAESESKFIMQNQHIAVVTFFLGDDVESGNAKI